MIRTYPSTKFCKESVLLLILSLLLFFSSFLFAQTPPSIQELESQLAQSAPDTGKVRIYHRLSKAYYPNDPTYSIELCREGLELAEHLQFEVGKMLLYNRLGIAHLDKGDFPESMIFHKKSLKIAQEVGNRLYEAYGYNNIGLLHSRMGNHDKGIDFLLQGLTIKEELNDKKGIANAYYGIGRVHIMNKDYEKAVNYIRQSQAIFVELGDSAGIASQSTALSQAYFLAQKFDSAAIFLDIGIEMYTQLDFKSGLAVAIHSKGEMLSDAGKPKEGLPYLMEGLALYRLTQNRYNEATCLGGICKAYNKLNEHRQALPYCEQCLSLAKEMGSLEDQKFAYQELSLGWSGLGDFQKAHEYDLLLAEVKDSLMNAEKSQQILELETRYLTEKKEQKIILQEQEILLLAQQDETKKRTIMGLVSGGGLLLVILIIGLYGQKQKLIANQNKEALTRAQLEVSRLENEKLGTENQLILGELEYKRKELTNFALHIVRTTEFIDSLKASVKQQYESGKSQEENKKLKKIYQQIKQNTLNDRNRETFQMQIEEANQEFFRKLGKRFPNLTENDRRIAALLRQEFTTKEIAILFNLEVKSIETYRYRLRKKLGLSPEEKIGRFLQEL